jgi:hypothetical protein
MEATFTPGVPASSKAKDRFRKMQEATAKLGDAMSVDLTEEGMNIADIVRSVRTNYGASEPKREDLRTGPADPSKKNLKPMKCTKCQYHGEPAHDGKCKECGEPMVPMSTSQEDFQQKDDDDQGDAPMAPPEQMPPSSGDPGGGAAPPPGMGQPGGSTMPPGEPDDGKDDDFDPSDTPSPEVGEMVAYAVTTNGGVRGSAGRVMLVYRGEASIDTGRKDSVGRSITHSVPVSSLTRIPEALLSTSGPANGRTYESRDYDAPRTAVATESRSKSRAQKLIEQVANGRRTADAAVKALYS